MMIRLAGKSSLFNRLFQIEPPLEEGISHTTLEVTPVYHTMDRKVVLWDSPGCNNLDFPLYDVSNVSLFHGMDFVAILYSTSLSTITELLQYVFAVKGTHPGQIVVVRTMVDQFFCGRKLKKTLDEELASDKAVLTSLGMQDIPIICTSSRFDDDNIDKAVLGKVENEKLKKLILQVSVFEILHKESLYNH